MAPIFRRLTKAAHTLAPRIPTNTRRQMKVIVTGAASGIGRACAQVIAQAVAGRGERPQLVLADYAADRLEEAAAELRSQGFPVVTVAGDLSRVEFPQEVAARAEREFGGVDAIVSNAGVIMTAPLADMSVDDYERMFAINTRATWLLAKACYPMLKRSRQASIVATASISASQPTPPHGAYSPSKAALVMLVRQMAYEWGPDGIRCNCVSPGMTHTGMTDQVYSDPQRRAERASHIPLRRVGDPIDIARVVAFLISPDAGYVTGVDLPVDGGVQTALMPTLRGAAVPR